MKYTLPILCLFAVLFLATSLSKSDSVNANYIGDIRASLIPPPRFEQLNPGWFHMNGRNVEGTEYYKLTFFDTIPDTRNRFLRGMGGQFDMADGTLNGQARAIGSFQNFSTAISKRMVADPGGSHVHKVSAIAKAFIEGHQHKTGEEWTTPGNTTWGAQSPNTDQPSGNPNHSHTISGGDPETRPVNITVYYYIKVD